MADQWDKSKPAGSDLISDIDTLIQTNNSAIDRLLINYKNGVQLAADTGSQFTVKSGEIAISNAGETIVRYRRNTGNTTVTFADLDTGSEAASTTYYVYATADVDETSFRVTISESSTAPSGITYFRRIGQFFNDSSSDITSVGDFSSTERVIQEIRTRDTGHRQFSYSTAFNTASAPTNTQGAAYSQLDTVIVPTSTTSIIHVNVNVNIDIQLGSGNPAYAGLFKDSDTNAIALGFTEGAIQSLGGSGGGGQDHVTYDYFAAAGTTNPITYKVRVSNSNTVDVEVNGASASDDYGGIIGSTVIVREIRA